MEKQEVAPAKADLSALKEFLPPFVARNWSDWKKYITVARGTIANADSLGTGPKKRVTIGNVVCYERDALIAWLEERSKKLS
ncbi:MAG TPA: hypothetical protein PKN70_11890 [Smithellaceae bacterium]|nr:hypothetical protein [Smithellaceae bacterium]